LQERAPPIGLVLRVYPPAYDNMRRDDAITEAGTYTIHLNITHVYSASPWQGDIRLEARRSPLQNDRPAGFIAVPMLK
jgi:hypothetical protein